MTEAGRIYHESAGPIKSKPEAERADAQEQLGPPYVHVGGGSLALAPEHVAVLKSYWESNVVKSAPVQLAAHVRHCRAKPCKKIEGKEGWTRIVFCLDPVTLPLEGALEAALLQKEVRKFGPASRARSIEAPNTDAREVERLAHRVEQYSLHMAGLLRRGVLEPFDGVCFPHDEGRTAGATAQIQGQSSGTKSRNDESRSGTDS